jgi:hypothetical protein
MGLSRNSFAAIQIVGIISCLLIATKAEGTTLFKHREATPQLPIDDSRLRRNDDAAAHDPEQVNSQK